MILRLTRPGQKFLDSTPYTHRQNFQWNKHRVQHVLMYMLAVWPDPLKPGERVMIQQVWFWYPEITRWEYTRDHRIQAVKGIGMSVTRESLTTIMLKKSCAVVNNTDKLFHIRSGERIAQIELVKTIPTINTWIDDRPKRGNRDGGFGSTDNMKGWVMTRDELKRHETLCKQGRDLMNLKNRDYAETVDKNHSLTLLDVAMNICSTEQGFLVRLTDKMGEFLCWVWKTACKWREFRGYLCWHHQLHGSVSLV